VARGAAGGRVQAGPVAALRREPAPVGRVLRGCAAASAGPRTPRPGSCRARSCRSTTCSTARPRWRPSRSTRAAPAGPRRAWS
jgi:hypothetical protein